MRDHGWRLTDGAVLGLALTTLACGTRQAGAGPEEGETGDGDGDPNGVPFELVSARLDATGERVILTFSEPVGAVGEVDPSDFRISYAAPESLCGDQGCEDITTYRDPNFFFDAYYAYDYQVDRFELVEITAGDQATEVSLRAETPLDPMFCGVLAYYQMYSEGYTLGLFVHHSPGQIPLTSADGEPLAGIGAQWVEQAEPVWYAEGNYPNLDPQIEIPCDL